MTTMVHVRVDEEVKEQATDALAAMGLTVSAAVKIFLTRVAVEKALPFELRVPNAATKAAMAEVDELARERDVRFATAEELFDALEKRRRTLNALSFREPVTTRRHSRRIGRACLGPAGSI